MKRIGLISDTHGWLDEAVFRYFETCDEIWHAGDIGSSEVLEKLQKFRTTRAVFGNIDDAAVRAITTEHLRWQCEGIDVWITHIGGRPGNYTKTLVTELKVNPPGLFICGHSHICMVKHDSSNRMIYMNPGAAGKHGFHQMRTILRFEIEDGQVKNLEVVELGKRA